MSCLEFIIFYNHISSQFFFFEMPQNKCCQALLILHHFGTTLRIQMTWYLSTGALIDRLLPVEDVQQLYALVAKELSKRVLQDDTRCRQGEWVGSGKNVGWCLQDLSLPFFFFLIFDPPAQNPYTMGGLKASTKGPFRTQTLFLICSVFSRTHFVASELVWWIKIWFLHITSHTILYGAHLVPICFLHISTQDIL